MYLIIYIYTKNYILKHYGQLFISFQNKKGFIANKFLPLIYHTHTYVFYFTLLSYTTCLNMPYKLSYAAIHSHHYAPMLCNM